MSQSAPRRASFLLSLLAGCAAASQAHAQVWQEVGNAGDLPATAQAAAGQGSLEFIFGSLDGADEVDMFQIVICDPSFFSATTVGQTSFDTILFLFDQSGMGVAMNDDSGGTLQSTITSQFITAPGVYYLALARYNRQAVSPGGRIFQPATFTTETGPNGPGGGEPISGWITSSVGAGAYSILLTGACMVDLATPGACCLPSGACAASTLGDCTAAGGSFAGANTTCAGTTCPPAGACCLPGGSCSTLTSAACTAQNGIWGGAGSQCGSCTGACCLPDGSCSTVSPQVCAQQPGSTFLGAGSSCGECRPLSLLPLPLAYNWNGLVTEGIEQGTSNYNNPEGYRAVADRGLLLSPFGGSITAAPVLGTEGITYEIVNAPGVLDVVHLGDRRVVANGLRNWGTSLENALQPSWLIDNDHTVPQVSPMLPVDATLSAQSRIGFLYQMSDFGGRFDAVLTFTDNTSATLTLRAPDWFNVQTVPAPAAGSGLIAQRMLGVYASTSGTDLANTTTNNLNVVEAVTSVSRLRADGFGDFAGKRLASITFQNAVSNATYANTGPASRSGVAILAATLSYPAGGTVCYANCDASTTSPVLNVDDFTCFVNEFAAAQTLPLAQQISSYANCDGSTIAPVLNVDDFTCFINAFAQGCP
jgi:hypothetical protein